MFALHFPYVLNTGKYLALLCLIFIFNNVGVTDGKYEPGLTLTSPITRTSVKRFSNLYGTVVSCVDYLLSGVTISPVNTGANSHNGNNNNNNGVHHHHSFSRLFTVNGIQLDIVSALNNNNYRDQSRLTDTGSDAIGTGKVNYGEQQQHQQQQQNYTFSWQVRTNVNSNKYRHSSTASTSGVKSNPVDPFVQVFNRANQRYVNSIDGTLSFAPFEQGEFVPEIHDAYYQCLLHLPQGILTSQEIHIQAGKCFSLKKI